MGCTLHNFNHLGNQIQSSCRLGVGNPVPQTRMWSMLRWLACAVLLGPARGWLAPQAPLRMPNVPLRTLSPLLKEVDVADLPMRPPMSPGNMVNSGGRGPAGDAPEPEEEEEEELTPEAIKLMKKAQMDAAVIGDANSKVGMERLKSQEDEDGGLSKVFGGFLTMLDPSGIVRRRLWTRADFGHIHAVSGAYFLFLGIPWLVYSHVLNALDTSVPMQTNSWFLTSLLLSGLVNALSAVPMSRFSSNKILDYKDLKANGFTFGGTGLTCMCLYIAWWFSGGYPDLLRPFDIPVFFFWALICVGTTANWETMLQQNFEANERKTGKYSKISKDEMNKKAILYRLASWPNLTQLTFMYSIPFGGLAWLQNCESIWPMQNTPMYHYGIASAMGYALSMFSETLRDRKLVTLETDLLILIIGFCFPMVSVIVDGLTYGSAVTISPPQYWVLFGAPVAAALGA